MLNKYLYPFLATAFVLLTNFCIYLVPRENFFLLFATISATFICYYFLIKKYSSKKLWLIGITARFSLLFALPNLSDDYFRFLWDGLLSISGITPFEYLPSEINQQFTNLLSHQQVLFSQMNSPNYFSVYPPVNQLFFMLGAFFSKHSILLGVIAIRCCIITGELFLFKYLIRLLSHFNLPTKHAYLYFLNPLIIIELTGNLHFEGIMLVFFLSGMYYLLQNKTIVGSILIGCAISTKLLPLLALPIFLRLFPIKKTIISYLIIGLTVVISFIPFISMDTLIHMGESIDLYFQTFEFNASIYYIVRWIGYKVVGWNIIQKAGPIMAICATLLILIIQFFRKKNLDSSFLTTLLFAYFIYFLSATIVHPWYLSTLVVLSIFNENYQFPLLWSFLIFLSYSAYMPPVFKEEITLIIIEYSLVSALLIYEVFKEKKQARRLALMT